MTKPAAMFGSYVGAKFMSSFKVMRISVDIPQQDCNEFLKMFGAPDAANPVPVFIARRADAKPAEPIPSGAPAPERSKPVPTDEPKSRAQFAGMKTKDPLFQQWLRKVYPDAWNGTVAIWGDKTPDWWANHVLKIALSIDSKKELNDGPKAVEWDRMLASFDAETKWGVR